MQIKQELFVLLTVVANLINFLLLLLLWFIQHLYGSFIQIYGALHLFSSSSGARYYICFVDGCSNYTWICLLNQKSQAFSAFLTLKNLVELQFGSKIKAIKQIMLKNTSVLATFSSHLAFYIDFCVLTPMYKMVNLKENITISLKLALLYLLMLTYLLLFGGKPFILQPT